MSYLLLILIVILKIRIIINYKTTTGFEAISVHRKRYVYVRIGSSVLIFSLAITVDWVLID